MTEHTVESPFEVGWFGKAVQRSWHLNWDLEEEIETIMEKARGRTFQAERVKQSNSLETYW